jgi:hypothetical protein
MITTPKPPSNESGRYAGWIKLDGSLWVNLCSASWHSDCWDILFECTRGLKGEMAVLKVGERPDTEKREERLTLEGMYVCDCERTEGQV